MAANNSTISATLEPAVEEQEEHVVLSTRKPKPIPPPLDLSTRHTLDTLSDFATIALSPRSPLLHNQKHLPFRKRAFSWSTFTNELNPNTASTSCSSTARSAYSSVIPASPRCHRLPAIKQEPSSQGDLPEDCEESPAFLTPVTPGPLSPVNFPSSPFFVGCNESFIPVKLLHGSSWNGSSALLSPAASVHSSSQEELALSRSVKNDDVFHGEDGMFGAKKDLYEERRATAELCEQFQRFDFAVPAARMHERRIQSSSDESASPGPTTTTKRPMNGFMLFAQKHRLQLIQQYPGRDNRAISVLLGDAWKKLSQTERELYTAEAHSRAEEYRRLHPDCWKRKRSKSTS